jgi:hypothetical protein
MAEQLYFDNATNQQYAFDPSVTVAPNAGGGFTFTAADGQVLPESTITTMEQGTAPVVAPVLTLAQQAQAMLGQGIAITSTGTSALNATYPIDPGTQALASQIVDYITTNSSTTFPGEPPSATLEWDDITGTAHTFPSVTEFKAFYDVAGDLVAAINEVIVGNSTTLPPATATIP